MSDLIYTALCPVFRGALACAGQKNMTVSRRNAITSENCPEEMFIGDCA